MTVKALAYAAASFAFLSAPAFADGYRVALDATFAPHAMPNLSGGIEGFNVDLAHAIGERLGKPIQIDAAQFSGLIPALQAGTYDFLVAPVTVTEERAQNLLFSEGVMAASFTFVERKGAPQRTGLADYAGKIIAVNKGSTYESYLNDRAAEHGFTVLALGTGTDAVEAVVAGRADAALSGFTSLAWAVQKNPAIQLGPEVPSDVVWSLSFRKDDVETRNRIDAVLECLKTDGTMVALSKKWFGVTPVEGSAIVTPTPGYGVPGFEGYEDAAHEVSCTF